MQHDRLEWENYLHKKCHPSSQVLISYPKSVLLFSEGAGTGLLKCTHISKYSSCALMGTHFPMLKESLAFVSATSNLSRVVFILEGEKYFCYNCFLGIWTHSKLFSKTSGQYLFFSFSHIFQKV